MSTDLNIWNQPEASPWNAESLLDQVGGNVNTAKLVAEEFTDLASVDREQLEQCFVGKDLSTVERLAFHLKSSYSVLGATLLCALAAGLEVACHNNDQPAARATCQRLCEEITRCTDYVPTLLQQLDDVR
jgi:HPt (histidine-containing phosphotransfer) domain-containing protein